MKIVFLLLTVSAAILSQHDPKAHQLAEAERSFSAASEKYGVKESFLQFLSDDCLMFNPYPVNGKELYRQRPANAAYLTWFPSHVEVSASGDFGISSGPWEYRNAKNDTTVAYGHYFSVWKKQSDGTWKVALDQGISYPLKEKRKGVEYFLDLPAARADNRDSGLIREGLLIQERAFVRMAAQSGVLKAYSKYASAQMRVYRNNNYPSQKRKESLGLLKKLPLQKPCSPVIAKSASSGDLGYTVGFSLDAKNDSSTYIRVWRKENGWKIAVDILEPFKK